MPENQTVVGEEEHSHPGDLHSHDHAPLVHAHEKYDEDRELADHNGTAHVHDHEDPMGMGL